MKTVQTSAAKPSRPRRPPAFVLMPALRLVRRDDGPALLRFIQALSSETRRQRFHVLLSGCGPAMLAILAGADGRRHVAYVATLPADDGECIVAEARYVVASDGESAEFALVVAEDWQGSGLADRLMDALIAQARASGLQRLFGAVRAGNIRMLRFTSRRGFIVSDNELDGADREAGSVRVELQIEAAPVALASPRWPLVASALRRWLQQHFIFPVGRLRT